MANITVNVVKKIGVISETPSGWQKQLNIVSWNEGTPKYDIRDWSPDGTKTSKGITLNNEEVQLLFDLLKEELAD